MPALGVSDQLHQATSARVRATIDHKSEGFDKRTVTKVKSDITLPLVEPFPFHKIQTLSIEIFAPAQWDYSTVTKISDLCRGVATIVRNTTVKNVIISFWDHSYFPMQLSPFPIHSYLYLSPHFICIYLLHFFLISVPGAKTSIILGRKKYLISTLKTVY